MSTSISRWGAPTTIALLVITLFAGATVAYLPPTIGSTDVLLAVSAAMLLYAISRSGPAASLAAIGVLTISGLNRPFFDLGGIGIQLADIFYFMVMGWFVLKPARVASRRDLLKNGSWVGLIFLAWIGVSVWRIGFADPAHFSTALLSWLRLVQTASLVWISADVLRDTTKMDLITGALVLGGSLAVGVSVLQLAEAGFAVTARYGAGLLNENALGLVGAILVVLGFFSSLPMMLRALSVLSGMTGLFLAKSIGSTLGVLIVVSVGMLWAERSQLDRRRTHMWTGYIVALAVISALLMGVVALRPESLPTSREFQTSAAYHRIILGSAGIRTFVENPIWGVGWQRSALPEVVGNEDLAIDLRRAFPDANKNLFPESTPTSVHNAYIQVPAELGMIGLVIFALIFYFFLRAVLMAAREQTDPEILGRLRLSALCVLLIAVWWNDNPIFGGQLETVVGAIFLGMMMASARLREPS